MMLKQLFLASVFLAQCASALAGPRVACGEYSAAYYEHGALYQREADGSWSGIDKDILEEIGKRTGCVFHTVLESRVRIWARMAAGTLDVTVSGIATSERLHYAQFVPYLGSRNYLLISQSVPSNLHSARAFAADPKLKVAVVKGFHHGNYYDNWLVPLRAQGRVVEAADVSAVINLLKIGRVQAMLALPTSYAVYFRRDKMGELVRVLDFAQKNDVIGGLVLSRRKVPPHAVAAMRKAIHAMREDGTLNTIYARYVGPEMANDLVKF
jgi:polar amino acid transport system substrate-binding protein